MASFSSPVKSTAVVLYDPTLPHISMKAHLESVCDEVARRSLEHAKYAARHISQIATNFTGRNFVHITSVSLNPPKSLKTDPCIDIEIFAAATGEEKPPILIFSHGFGQPGKYRPFLGELASHGYTVLSLTHPSSAEDEEWASLEQAEARTDELAAVMVKNIQYVLNRVRNGALKITGDPNRIILMGHSLGGAASIMVSRIDPAISGCVNLDGSLKGGAEKTDALPQPLLMLIGDYQKKISEDEQDPKAEMRRFAKFERQWQEEYETLLHNSPNSYKQVIPNAIHMDFTDEPFRDSLAGKKTLSDAMRVHTIASREVLKFMQFCLSGK